MPYASVDDNMTEHPKVERLSDAAFRAYVTSICFCSRNLTDGMILRHQAAKVGATAKITRELVDGRCWDEREDGWYVHDYLEWNKSRADIEEFRARQRAAGLASGRARGSTIGLTSGLTKQQPADEPNVEPSSPRPQPLPNPLPPAERPRDDSPPMDWYRYVVGREPFGAAEKQQVSDYEIHPPECRAWAFSKAIGKLDPPSYVKTVFDSCILGGEGHGPRGGKNGAKSVRARGAADHRGVAGESGEDW